MRSIRLLLVGAVIAAAGLAPNVVVAGSGDTAGGSGRLFVSGDFGTVDRRVSIGAHESNGVTTGMAFVGPDGAAHGALVLANTFINGSGNVVFDEFIVSRIVCLEVTANQAVAVGQIVRASPGSSVMPGQFIRAWIEDNGEPMNGQPVDLFGADEGSAPGGCTFFSQYLEPFTTGNFTVTDSGL
jgi:hypothetical protein